MKIYSRYSDKNLTRETHYLMDYLTLREWLIMKASNALIGSISS